MSALEALRAKQSEIQAIAAKHGAGNLRVFGSVARGDTRPDSDIDLLIDIVGPTTPWFPGSLLAELEKTLGRRVDIVITRSLSPLLREEVLRDAIPL
jgi:predicted nucleotidyltransferase